MTISEKTANPIDVFVGGKVRLRRKFLRLSQEALAASMDLTFQQVQKYELGSNRISASKLHVIARKLEVPVSYFFEGYEEDSDEVAGYQKSDVEAHVHTFLLTAEGIELAQAFPAIKNAKWRRKILELVRSLSED